MANKFGVDPLEDAIWDNGLPPRKKLFTTAKPKRAVSNYFHPDDIARAANRRRAPKTAPELFAEKPYDEASEISAAVSQIRDDRYAPLSGHPRLCRCCVCSLPGGMGWGEDELRRRIQWMGECVQVGMYGLRTFIQGGKTESDTPEGTP